MQVALGGVPIIPGTRGCSGSISGLGTVCLQALGEGLAGLLEDAAVVGTGRLCDQVAFKRGVLLTHRATCHLLLSPNELTCSLVRVMAGHCPVVPL